MNCSEVRQHWELYYDSEGDSELYLRVNEHLANCPGCSKWLFQQGSLEDALAAKLSAPPPTPDLWQRVLSEARLAEPIALRSWSFFSPIVALAAILLLALGVWQFKGPSQPEHLSALTAVVHRQLTSGAEPIEFVSVSDEEVEAYLKRRVSFPVRCPPRKDAGFIVRGGGVCQIAGKPAAYVCGQVGDSDVSIFVLPQERLAEFIHERKALQEDPVHHCREKDYDMVLAKIDRNIVVVIGHGRPDQLEKVVRAYGTYPERPAAERARSLTQTANIAPA